MGRSKQCAAIFGSCLLAGASLIGCSSGPEGRVQYLVMAGRAAGGGESSGQHVVCRQGGKFGRLHHGQDQEPVCVIHDRNGAHASDGGGRPRQTGTTIVRQAGARDGNLVASQTSGEIDLHMTQVHEVTGIELVREGPRADWQHCARVELVSSRRSLVVSGEYRATRPRHGRVRERIWARLRPGAVRMLSQQDAVTVRMCGLELDVNASFRRAVADSQRRTIHATLALADNVTMRLQATPSDPTDAAWLTLSVRSQNHEYRGCGVTVLANGDALPLPVLEYVQDEGEDHYRGRVPLSAILEMAEAIRTIGAVCEQRFGLLESHQNQLRDFLMRFKEERSFANGAGNQPHRPMGAEGTIAL